MENKYLPKNIWILFAVILLIFLTIELKGFTNLDPGDEFVYIYMGKLMSEGNSFYKDFFFSHQPLHLLITALVYKIFGFRIVLFKLIPFFSVLITTFFIFKLVKEKFSNLQAITAIILFLFSYELLKYSTYSLGINLTTMFLMAGIYYLYSKKYMLSGCLFGFASITGLYAIPLILVPSFILFLKNKKNFIRLIGGFLIIFGITNILFFLLYGQAFLTQVYKYHLMKPPVTGYKLYYFTTVIKSNLILFASPLLYVFSKDKKRLSLIIMTIIFYLLFLSFLGRIFKIYFILIFPLLAIVGSYSIFSLKYKQLRLPLICILLVLVIFTAIKSSININKVYFAKFDAIDMVSYINQNSKPDETIFGDVSITPMLALLSNRKIALDMVDTNKMVFESGIIKLKDILDRLDKEGVKFIIIRPFTDIETIKEFKDYIEEKCNVTKYNKDKYFGDFFILDCQK